jgi:hypothetical protein
MKQWWKSFWTVGWAMELACCKVPALGKRNKCIIPARARVTANHFPTGMCCVQPSTFPLSAFSCHALKFLLVMSTSLKELFWLCGDEFRLHLRPFAPDLGWLLVLLWHQWSVYFLLSSSQLHIQSAR